MAVFSVAIKKDVLKSALEASRNLHPDEFIGVLQGRIVELGGASVEVQLAALIIAPFSEYAESWSGFSEWFIPTSREYIGTVHSHPNAVLLPSAADKRYWSRFGRAHLIVGPPYSLNSWAAFDARGKPVLARVID